MSNSENEMDFFFVRFFSRRKAVTVGKNRGSGSGVPYERDREVDGDLKEY